MWCKIFMIFYPNYQNFELHDQARSYLFTNYFQQCDHAKLYIILFQIHKRSAKKQSFAWSWIKILFDHRWFSATWSCIVAHYICSKFTKDHTINKRKILTWYWIKISFDHSWISSTWSCKIVHYICSKFNEDFARNSERSCLKFSQG